jgi:membrane-associated protease RseP (regulator of RpoE activity)
VLPPGLEDFDVAAYFDAAKPITVAVLGSTAVHELGHLVAGLVRGVALSPPFFIPNGQLGTFGAVTQIKSRPKNRSHLFDVAAAGPFAGGALALALFVQVCGLSLLWRRCTRA